MYYNDSVDPKMGLGCRVLKESFYVNAASLVFLQFPLILKR